jgi:molybdopterin converting factor small subunit
MAERNYTIDEQIVINHIKSQEPHICYYCSKNIVTHNDLTIEHKYPVSRGGLTIKDNLVIACSKCNSEKADMTEQEYYNYKEKQEELQKNFEVNKVVNNLLNTYDEIIKRSDEIRQQYFNTCKEIEYLQENIILDNFNASEGYFYAKQLKELLNRKNELFIMKEEYNHLRTVIGNHNKNIKDVSIKISDDLYEKNKKMIKKQINNKVNTFKNNVVEFKSAVI